MTRSITFEIPDSPRAVIQRSAGKTIVVMRVEDARALLAELEEGLSRVYLADMDHAICAHLRREDIDDS